MKSMIRLLMVAAVAALVAGCAATPLKYTTNARALVDVMHQGSEKFVSEIELDGKARVSVLNLEASMDPSGYPSTIVYDMLAMALTKKGITVVERDQEGLYASVLEGWSNKLPFYVTNMCEGKCPCDGVCPEKDPCGPDCPQPKPVLPCCPAGQTPIVPNCTNCVAATGAAVSAAAIPPVSMPKAPKLAAKAPAAADPGLPPMPEATTSKRPDYADLFILDVPRWFTKDGKRIVTEQMSATHVLGYRLIYYGTSIEPTEDDDVIKRITRADLVLRLINTKYGTLEWSDRVKFSKVDKYPEDAKAQLSRKRFSYTAPQYKGKSSGGVLGGLLGGGK